MRRRLWQNIDSTDERLRANGIQRTALIGAPDVPLGKLGLSELNSAELQGSMGRGSKPIWCHLE